MSIIVALDTATEAAAYELADQLDPALCRLKVGKELFTRCGPAIVKGLQGRGFELFLDLKFHDIPNTTAQAVLAAADLGVWMVNVHASGGPAMMSEARQRLSKAGHSTLLIAVTILTSMDQQQLSAIGISTPLLEQVTRLATLAESCGLDGVVCSALEVSHLKSCISAPDFHFVTPGIRPASAAKDDQQRVMTPQQAMQAGSTELVIGRPITQAPNPKVILQEILSTLTTH